MERKRVLLVVGAVLVFILTGALGTYSAWGSPRWGLTYRWNNWGGLKIETKSGFGGEVLFSYFHTNEKDDKHEIGTGFQPSLTYYFRGSSNTSPYVGLGYFSFREEVKDLVTFTYEVSGPTLLLGIEHFLNKNFSCDFRITAYFQDWGGSYKADGESWKGAEGTHSEIDVDLGFSVLF